MSLRCWLFQKIAPLAEVKPVADGTKLYGVGIGKNIVVASLKAVVSGVSLAIRE